MGIDPGDYSISGAKRIYGACGSPLWQVDMADAGVRFICTVFGRGNRDYGCAAVGNIRFMADIGGLNGICA